MNIETLSYAVVDEQPLWYSFYDHEQGDGWDAELHDPNDEEEPDNNMVCSATPSGRLVAAGETERARTEIGVILDLSSGSDPSVLFYAENCKPFAGRFLAYLNELQSKKTEHRSLKAGSALPPSSWGVD